MLFRPCMFLLLGCGSGVSDTFIFGLIIALGATMVVPLVLSLHAIARPSMAASVFSGALAVCHVVVAMIVSVPAYFVGSVLLLAIAVISGLRTHGDTHHTNSP